MTFACRQLPCVGHLSVRLHAVAVSCVVRVCRFGFLVVSSQHCFVMSSDKRFHVLAAAVAHFSPTNKLHKLFNRHTVRVSYSCSENMKSFILRHNKTILRRHDQKTETTNTNYARNCNCRRTERWSTQGNCLQANVIYKADVTTTDNNETKTYIGVRANNFKTRYRNHCKSLSNRRYKNETELSKHVWQLRDSKREFTVKWKIIRQNQAGSRCRLYLEEKLLILKGQKKSTLIKRSELFTKCRHVPQNLLHLFSLGNRNCQLE